MLDLPTTVGLVADLRAARDSLENPPPELDSTIDAMVANVHTDLLARFNDISQSRWAILSYREIAHGLRDDAVFAGDEDIVAQVDELLIDLPDSTGSGTGG